jgi:hypothetical protein
MAPSETDQIKAITDTDSENARLMLVHAAKTGMDLPKDMLLTLTAAIEGARSYDGRPVQPADFWLHFAMLTKMLAPVTPESLRCCVDGQSGMSPARRTAQRYARFGYAIFALLLAAQAYGLLLASAVETFRTNQDVLRRYDHWQEVARRDLRAALKREPTPEEIARERGRAQAAAEAAFPETTASVGPLTRTLVEPGDYDHLVATQNASLDSIGRMAGFASWVVFPRYVERGETVGTVRVKNFRDVQGAQFLLDLFNRYLLPILYGLLGASLYVVRSLAVDIRRALYSERMRAGINLRLMFGGLAGALAAWAVLPASAASLSFNTPGTTLAFNLAPFALAFVAGYAIELLFSAMDRVLAAFAPSRASCSSRRLTSVVRVVSTRHDAGPAGNLPSELRAADRRLALGHGAADAVNILEQLQHPGAQGPARIERTRLRRERNILQAERLAHELAERKARIRQGERGSRIKHRHAHVKFLLHEALVGTALAHRLGRHPQHAVLHRDDRTAARAFAQLQRLFVGVGVAIGDEEDDGFDMTFARFGDKRDVVHEAEELAIGLM